MSAARSGVIRSIFSKALASPWFPSTTSALTAIPVLTPPGWTHITPTGALAAASSMAIDSV